MRYTKYHEYLVFEDGRVQNPDGTYRKHNTNFKGYIQISMKINGKWTTRHLHTLLYKLFVSDVPKGYEVDHINNVRSDFRLCNLQMLTKSENNKKAWDSGNRPDITGQNNPNSRTNQKRRYTNEIPRSN